MTQPDLGERSAVSVSVVICTRNRAGLLDRCLASIDAIDSVRADRALEVLVVDNGSSDGTSDVVDKWTNALPLRTVVEPRQGLSHARNRAIAESTADVLAFLDDDVLLGDAWLEGVREAMLRFPDAVGLAGRVDLQWSSGRPGWLPETREPFFARTDLGDECRLLEHDEWPVGANMAVRRRAAERVGGFDSDLGYSGTSLLGNEEIDFFARLRADAGVVVYHPGAAVQHIVESDRATRSYLLRRLYAQGRSDARMEAMRAGTGSRDARREAWAAAGRATVRGWRGDLARLRRPGGVQRNAIEIATGRARQAGRAREWVTISHTR